MQEWLSHADIDTIRRYLHFKQRGDEAALLAGAFEVAPVVEQPESAPSDAAVDEHG